MISYAAMLQHVKGSRGAITQNVPSHSHCRRCDDLLCHIISLVIGEWINDDGERSDEEEKC